jgi:xylulokinase
MGGTVAGVGGVTVGIDIGTTSVKAVAAGDDGEVLARCRIPHDLVAPSPDRFEHDPAQAWSAGVVEAWRQVRDGAGQPVAAVTVAAMVPSMCGVDASGRPVTPGLLYGDARGRADVDGGEAAGLAAWLAATSDADGLWPAQAVANHTLAGVGAIDTVTAMAMMPLFDGVRWDDGLCARLGVDAARLPALSPGTTAIGEVDGVPLNGGTVDVFAEQLVADARDPGDVLVLCGTTLIPWALTTGWPEVEGLWTVPYTLPGLTAVGGASNAGGLFVDSVRRLLGPVDDGELDGLVPGEVPVWLPYLRGERTPLHDPDRRGELVGVALGQGPAAVLRAAYEATAFVVRHHVELSGVPARRIVAVGGGTRCAPWMQALADGTGLPVDVSAVPEGAALGAAFLARVTAGLEPDTSGAIAWSRLAGRVEPRPPWAEACEGRYATFLERTRR